MAEVNREDSACFVAVNSIFQVLFYSVFAYLFITVLPPVFGLKGLEIQITMGQIAESVAIYLGLPFAMRVISRYSLIKLKGEAWFQPTFIPFISTVTTIDLLFTIVPMLYLTYDL